ncbi:MAG: hypothetical protein WBB29_18145 [Geitlerinemataceae cyanobacterium]
MTLAKPPTTQIPLLENGDCLTRTEFERRYYAMPHCKKAELIERQVYRASPVRARKHGQPHAAVMGGYRRGQQPLTPTSENATSN